MKRYVLKYALFVLMACFGMQQVGAKVWYVNSPTVKWQGKNAADVKDDIVTALSGAASGDQIWVAAGTFSFTETITLVDGVSLYGGFAGTESKLDARSRETAGKPWEFTKPTILDVQTKARVLTGMAFSKTVTIDGFTIKNGRATTSAIKTGGGIYSEKNTIVRNCIFTGNNVSDAGGGLNLKGDNSVVEDCYFFQNKARHGGGAAIGSPAIMNRCLVENNTTNSTTSTTWSEGWGGGIFCDNGTVSNCEIYGNKASFGGGIYFRNANSVCSNCIIAYNVGHQGGGVAWDYRSKGGKCVNSMVVANTAGNVGGGFLFNGDASNSPVNQTVVNCVIWNNTAKGVLSHYTLYNSSSKKEWEFTPKLSNNAFQGEITGLKGNNHIALLLDSAAYFDKNWMPKDDFPGIDKGTMTDGVPDSDLAGNIRIFGKGIDIGAYEYVSKVEVKPDGDIFYVDPDVTGGKGDGSSWANALTDLNFAIASAKKYNTEKNKKTKIWVAAGTFKMYTSVLLQEGVSIYGGFKKTEKSEAEREIGASDKSWDFANATVLESENNTGLFVQNSHYGKYDAVVDGFTFKGVSNSSDGGAMSMKDYGIVQNCQFIDCQSSAGGGGVFFAANAGFNTRVRLRNCYFSGCSAKEGGAVKINAYMASGDVTGCVVENCEASNCGGGIYTQGSVSITNCIVKNNQCMGKGDKVGGGGIFVRVRTNIVGCLIVGNKAVNGAGIYTIFDNGSSQNINIVNNTIARNTASGSGGGYMSAASNTKKPIYLVNNIFWTNSSADGKHQIAFCDGMTHNISNNAIEGQTDFTSTDLLVYENNITLNGADSTAIFGKEYALLKTSPCVDQGKNATPLSLPSEDVVGNIRMVNEVVDMGAYEYCSTVIAPSRNGIFYVMQAVSPDEESGGGSSWDNHLTSVSVAVGAAKTYKEKNPSKHVQIWIAGGTYTIPASLELCEDVSIYGGFAGTETSLDQRQKVADGKPWEFEHETILDGGGATQLFNQKSDFTTTTYVDGLTFRNAKHTGKGGAMYIQADVRIQYCKFLNNTTSGNGGAINFVGKGNLSKVVYSYFYGNSASNGGAIFTENSKAEVENCWVEKNRGEKRGGGIYVYQGTVRNTYVAQNHCVGNEAVLGGGGGLYGRDGGKFYNCIVVGNTSNRGAGIMAGLNSGYSFVTEVYNCVVADNKGSEGGAGLHASPCKSQYGLKAYNTVLWNNTLNTKPGARMELVQLFNCALQNGDGIDENVDRNCIAITDKDAAFDGEWKPVEGSPCIDAGTLDGITLPETDYAGNKRVSNRKVDIGVYEYQNPADVFEINYADEILVYTLDPGQVVEYSADRESWVTVPYSSLIQKEDNKGFCRLQSAPDRVYAIDIPGRGEAAGEIDIKNETLKSFAKGAEWNVTGAFTAVGNGKLTDYIAENEKELTVRQPATETAFKSEKVWVVPARPAAPAGWTLSYAGEKLSGIEDLSVLETAVDNQYVAMTDSSVTSYLTTEGAVVLNIRYRATDKDFASYPWSIELAARPEAPVYTIHYADSTTVEVVSQYVMYDTVENFANPLYGTDEKLKLQPGHTYYFKWVASEEGHVFNSAMGILEVPVVTTLAAIRVNFSTEKLEGLNEHVHWKINGGEEEQAAEDISGLISMENDVTLTLYVPAGINAFATPECTVVLPKREAAPQWAINYTDEVIYDAEALITPDNWEIRLSEVEGFIPLDESGLLQQYIPDHADGERVLLLRVAAGTDVFHSEACEVVLPVRPEKPEITINFSDERTNEVIPAHVEYSVLDDMEAAVAGEGTTIVVEPGIDLYFRAMATENSFASGIRKLAVPERPAISEVEIDFEHRTLPDLPRATVWQVNEGEVAPAQEDLTEVIPAVGEPAATLKIWVPEQENSFKSEIIALRLPAYPADPQLTVNFEKEQLEGVTGQMVWKHEDVISAADTDISALIPAYGEDERTLTVWVAASDTNFRSLGDATVILPARKENTAVYSIDYIAETTSELIEAGVSYSFEPENGEWNAGNNEVIQLHPGTDIWFKRQASAEKRQFASAPVRLEVPARPVIVAGDLEIRLADGDCMPDIHNSWTNTFEGIEMEVGDPEIALCDEGRITPKKPGECRLTLSLDAVEGEHFAAEPMTVNLKVVSDGNADGELAVSKLKIAGRSDMVFRIPELAGASGVGLVIYNQRGKVIFETKEYGHNFDMGRLDSGTYYYVLTYPKDGRQQKKKGFVEIVR